MKPIASLALALMVGACAAPAPLPKPAPPPPLAAPPAAAPVEWRDLPESTGRWRYGAAADGSRADFVGSDGVIALSIRCLRIERTVAIVRTGGAAGQMLITTSYAGQNFLGVPAPDGTIAARLSAADKFLDMIAFSRGRFSIAAPGASLLVVPAWAEPARVIEDCRA